MENFVAYNPVKLHFGMNCTQGINEIARKYGTKALLVYGQNSVIKFGYLNKILSQLPDIEVIEYKGIKPNPVIEDVYKAIEKGKEQQVDMVIGLGGGSVIDSAKVIAVGIANEIDVWDFMKSKVKATKSLPLICILTLAATGTEMNGAAVIQNHQANEKIGFVSPLMYPAHSYLDPSFTYTVGKSQTAFATADIIAHALEAYFGKDEPEVTDQITFGIIRTAITYGKLCISGPNNFEYRYNHMLSATLALNGTSYFGKKGGDWGVHGIGHLLSLLFDTPHGATLSIVYPAWLKYHSEIIPERIIKLGKHVFGVESVDDTILHFENYFAQINCPIRLNDLSLTREQIALFLESAIKSKVSGANYQLNDVSLTKMVALMSNN